MKRFHPFDAQADIMRAFDDLFDKAESIQEEVERALAAMSNKMASDSTQDEVAQATVALETARRYYEAALALANSMPAKLWPGAASRNYPARTDLAKVMRSHITYTQGFADILRRLYKEMTQHHQKVSMNTLYYWTGLRDPDWDDWYWGT
jgi:hypothetical protein